MSDYHQALKAWQSGRNGSTMPEAFRIGPALKPDPERSAALERVRGWTRARFALSEEAAILVAQAIGRLGNWFNQELFGRPTTLPWGLEIAAQYRPAGYGQFATFHPTFLYEMLWNLAAAVLLVWLDRRFRLGHGKVFALYVMLYCAGRFWIEALRIDTVNEIGGFRLNNYTALIGFVVALVWFLWLIRNRPGREEIVEGGVGLSGESVAEGSEAEMSSGTDSIGTESDAADASDQGTSGQTSGKDPTVAP